LLNGIEAGNEVSEDEPRDESEEDSCKYAHGVGLFGCSTSGFYKEGKQGMPLR
jgi:hypothetical protein